MRGAAGGEGGKGGLGGGVFGLAEGGAVERALEVLAVEIDDGLEAGGVVGAFADAGVGGEVEAAPLRQLLKLVLVHLCALYPLDQRPFNSTNSKSEEIWKWR